MRVAIVYATREGQTRRIAEYLVGAFHARDVPADVFNAKETPDPDLDVYDALIVAASVHIGKHEPEMVRFVRKHREALTRIPTALISVSMSQAGVEMITRNSEQRERARIERDRAIERFLDDTGWRARWLEPVAGALLYSKYSFFTKFIMKMISKRAGGSTDTSHDHEYTDWIGLERLSARVIDDIRDRGAERLSPTEDLLSP